MNKNDVPIFRPGWGQMPPVLAGRENEKTAITEALSRLNARSNPVQNIVLIGPRGNGKTTLLRWTDIQVGRYNGGVKCLDLNPDCFKSHAALIIALAHRGVISSIAEHGFSLSLSLIDLETNLGTQKAAKKLLRTALEKRCSKNGLVVMVDEAHTLNRYPNVARAFFTEVQALVGNGRPLLLILAGTPSIARRLNMIDVTFWNQLKKIGIGLLDAAAAREALRVPLERMGYGVEAHTLKQAVNEAQCYPYFIQIIGDALHKAARSDPGKLGSSNEIGNAILDLASKEFNYARNNYHSDRYQELRGRGILTAAEAVARLFVSRKVDSISTAAVETAIAQSITLKLEEIAMSRGGIEPAVWIESELRDSGFVWSHIGCEHLSEPGIYSLMHYIVEAARERELEERRIFETTRHASASGRNDFGNALPN